MRPASPPPTGPGFDKAALALAPRELWIAAHVPQLPLLAIAMAESGAATSAAPLVVVDPEDHNPRIIDADASAQAAGVRIGMTLGAALAAVPAIDARPRDAARELALMQRLAGIAATFTPQVSIEPPDGLLLEIKPSITLFGGLRELCRRLRDACRADPVLSAGPRCSRISRSRPPRWPRSRRRAPARAVSSPIRACCPRDSNHCHSPRCAGPRKQNARLLGHGRAHAG